MPIKFCDDAKRRPFEKVRHVVEIGGSDEELKQKFITGALKGHSGKGRTVCVNGVDFIENDQGEWVEKYK